MLGSAYQDYRPGLGQGYKCLKLKLGGFVPNGVFEQWSSDVVGLNDE